MSAIIATTAPVVCFLNLKLHEDGAMSIEGNVDDWRTCREMLDGAHAALRHRAKPKEGDPKPQTQMITETSFSK
jgi:hypothetical protein